MGYGSYRWSGTRGRLGGGVIAAAAAIVVAVPPALASSPGTGRPAPGVTVLSGRPDMVTGGDALVRIDVPGGIAPHRVRIVAGGSDVTDAFAVDRAARALTGMVTGLPLGRSEIRADLPGRGMDASLTVTNHPQEGPVLSGPHEEPFICETESYTIPVIGGTLGQPLDENCSVADRVDYFYRTTSHAYRPWPAGATQYPADVRTITTSAGATVPFVVRMETGTVNRAIFATTVLHDPLAESAPSPTRRPAAWNGGAIFALGGGCPGGWYRQGGTTGSVTNDWMLGQGYAVMSSSLNVFGQNCNDLLAAESATTVREEFIERYGPPDHLIGFGSSGGAYQGLQIGDNYPGVFDGIVIGASFPDVGFGTVNFVTDAQLLHHYFTTTADAGLAWTEEQRRAVTGFRTYATAVNVASNAALRINPRYNCGHLPPELRYDPVSNPGGARCDVYSHAVNVYGTDPETGFVRRPLDNVGIQYGLGPLNDGTITVDQFLGLNENVGGFDADANLVPERTAGDPAAVRAAYRTGRLTNGGGGLASIPIIDHREYLDEADNGDLHVRYHTLSLRQRLINVNGTAANHVSLLRESRHPDFGRHALVQMDRWLRGIRADASGAAPIDKIVAHRPAGLLEGCYTREADPVFIAEPLDRDPGSRCERLYPSASFPREVAGDSIAADVIKCRTKEPERDDYAVALTDDHWRRLRAVFADGVCDYTKPGVEQQGLAGTWLRF
jgi:hypothetical protein